MNFKGFCATLFVTLFISLTSLAGEPVKLVVLQENVFGVVAVAQNYLNNFVTFAATQFDWEGAEGQYYITRAETEKYIREQNPRFGILTLAAYLDFQKKFPSLRAIGTASVSTTGGSKFFLMSKSPSGLEGCIGDGKKIATNQAGDPKFFNVISGGKFSKSNFEAVEFTRVTEGVKTVLASNADCALVNEVQKNNVKGLISVWESETLPPMVLVDFNPTGTKTEASSLGLTGVCSGQGKTICDSMGIQVSDLNPQSNEEIQTALKNYHK